MESLFNPEHYQGWSKSKNYFEGWYFKMLNAACDQALAIIPGISMDPEGKQEAFIQVLNGKLHRSEFYRFNGAAFKAKPGIFDIQIEENRFSETEIILNLPEIKGRLQFENLVGWPKPGILQELWDLMHLYPLWNVIMGLLVWIIQFVDN